MYLAMMRVSDYKLPADINLDQATFVMERYQPIDPVRSAEAYRREGWSGTFDPQAPADLLFSDGRCLPT
jgi:hypothetical protein